MKKKVLCGFSLILYILIVCTLLSLKIEMEMQTQADVWTVYGSRLFGENIELPGSFLFSEDGADHLFEIEEGTGWESGLRSREISNQEWSISATSDSEKVILAAGTDYTLIRTASRVPQAGELVEVIEDPQIASDIWLVYYPEGVPTFEQLPSGTEEISRNENALLLSVDQSKFPFFEHRALGELKQIAGKDMRVFSLTTVNDFLDQIPSLVTVLLLLLIPVVLWVFSCFLSINAHRNKWLIALNILLAITSLFLLQSVLGKIDLPAAMLPDGNIFDWQHYNNEFSLIFGNLEKMGIEAGNILR